MSLSRALVFVAGVVPTAKIAANIAAPTVEIGFVGAAVPAAIPEYVDGDGRRHYREQCIIEGF